MSYNPYPGYSANTNDWIGSLPSQWKRVQIKRKFRIVNGSTPSSDPEYWDGDIAWITPADFRNTEAGYFSETARMLTLDGLNSCGTSLVPVNSIVITTRAPIGGVAQGKVEFCSNQGCKSLALDSDDVHERFVFYVLSASGPQLNALGLGSTFMELSTQNLGMYPFPLPPLPEQQQIAAFLDWKTGQIDGLFAKKKELLEKLKVKRLAVITQAVTRGLNPEAPLKDSGIPWLGQVPEHWEVRRLKDYGRLIGGAGFPIDEQGLTDEELPFYKVGDLKEAADGRNMVRAPNTISRETAERLSAKVIPAGAVVYAKIGAALLLNRRRVTTMPCCIDNNMTAYIPDPAHMDVRWVHYWLSILDFGKFVNPGAVPSLSEGYQSVIPIFVPALTEQVAIADYLDAALPKIHQLVDAIERTIERLTEYRIALITAATTGKIDVRNVRIPEPAA